MGLEQKFILTLISKLPKHIKVYTLMHDGFICSEEIPEEKMERLNRLGFDWDPHETIWTKRYDELRVYKSVNGNCNVPQGYPDNPQLAAWVAKQRENNKNGKLSEEKVAQLDDLGFRW